VGAGSRATQCRKRGSKHIPSRRETAKNHEKKDIRSSFLAPFRADRATAVSDIIVRVAADDLRQKAAAEAHGMSVYVWSAFLAVLCIGRISR